MKRRLLDLLCCPKCRGDLQLAVFEEHTAKGAEKISVETCRSYCDPRDGTGNPDVDYTGLYKMEIMQGLLTCACGNWYPIINGLPRMLLGALKKDMLSYHQDYVESYKDRLPADETVEEVISGSDTHFKQKTLKSYSYQWPKFNDMYQEWGTYFLDFIHPFEKDFFPGMVVLDAGAGFGRFAHFSTQFGGETIAMDLSEAAEAAYRINEGEPFTHCVQGDIYNLPFRRKFDFIYCIGVIQHLPDKEEGFHKIADLVRPGTQYFVWVYSKRKGLYKAVEAMRPMTVNRPFWLLNILCFGLAILQEFLFLVPYRILRTVGLCKVASKIPYTRYAHYPFRHNHADWFDRLSVPLSGGFDQDEVRGWYEKDGFEDVHVVPRTTGWRAWGTKRDGDSSGN